MRFTIHIMNIAIAVSRWIAFNTEFMGFIVFGTQYTDCWGSYTGSLRLAYENVSFISAKALEENEIIAIQSVAKLTFILLRSFFIDQ